MIMFTGIVEHLGCIKEIETQSAQGRIMIHPETQWDDELSLGESIAVDGVCLTLANQTDGLLQFDVLSETFNCTNLGERKAGDLVNLERAMPYGHRMGGHIVQGHIDGAGKIVRLDHDQDDWVLGIQTDEQFSPYLAFKGSIAINGISLTVARVTENGFEVHLIPHTWEHTSLKQTSIGATVNLEVDVIAKYSLRQLQTGAAPVPPSWEDLVDSEKLS